MDQWTAINTRWICFRHFSTRPRLLPVFLLLESYFAILFRHCCTATVIPTKMKCEVKCVNFVNIRPVSTQDRIGSDRIGLDFLPSCIIHTTGPKKVENASTLYHPGCRSQVQTATENWYRKPMRGFNFAPIPCLFT